MLAPLKVTLCSGNEGKLVEVQEALPEWEVELLDARDYPDEDGATYVENARIKARFGRRTGPADRWMLADDSGLELAALGGRPGVQTARWAEGRHVERALAALEGSAQRGCRYVAELVLLAPDGHELGGTGVLEGSIAAVPAGRGGFGFDPVFVPSGETRTVAELGDEWKAAHSHRALAAQALRVELARHRGS
jgi:XTP/dITP diphosphohydrolase